jgi:hypothetical protein
MLVECPEILYYILDYDFVEIVKNKEASLRFLEGHSRETRNSHYNV